jgi:ferredoxin-nitrate reductase
VDLTLCPYCGTGCGLQVDVRDGRVAGVRGDARHPVNRGRTCRKPTELGAAVHARDRATAPLLRRGGRLVEAGWAEAFGEVAGKLRAILAEHGPDAVAFYISGQLLTEDYYAVNKLAKGFLGTNNVDANSRLCMSSAVAGYAGAFGADGPPPAYADLALADCVLLLGTNTAACHPIVWSRIRDRQAEGATVIVADPRVTPTAQAADLHLPVRPGTDLPLLNAMLHVIDAEGLVDQAFVARHTTGFEEALAVAREWTPARAAGVCGVPAADIVRAAERFAGAGAAMTLWSMGANQSTVGTLKNRALINLCLATGNLGRPGCGPLSLTGQPNAMGGREVGGLAHLLPGYRRVDDGEDRAAIAAHWGVPVDRMSPRPGLTATELTDALLDGRVRALLVAATNPVVSLPDGARVREALRRAELLVVQDCHHPTETSALAHAVLPAAAWPEKEGTMTNSERRVGLVRKLLDPPGAARPDWQITAGLAAALGFGDAFAWSSPAEVYAEFAACTAGRPCDVSGLSHERLRREGSVQWPAPASPVPAAARRGAAPLRDAARRRAAPLRDAADGTARLYADLRVHTPDGRARFAPTPHTPPADAVDPDWPLVLTTGRLADQWHTMTRTGKSPALRAAAGAPTVSVHPDDAPGIADGDRVRVASRHGEVLLTAALDPTLPRGVAFAPFHFGLLHALPGAGQLNDTVRTAVDPVSKQPELKAIAVRVAAAGAQPAARRPHAGRLVIAGTGMAGLAVAEEVVKRDPSWRITMLGEEPGFAYNRIQLSRLLAGACGPGALELRPGAWYAAHGIDLRGGCAAAAIDTAARTVRDVSGEPHPYDALVIATGSRAFVPPIPGAGHAHVFRTRADVAALSEALPGARDAVVLGGGLLGLEAAAGLRAHGLRVTVVEPAPHLMARQLDGGAASMLTRALAARGIAALPGRTATAIAPAGAATTAAATAIAGRRFAVRLDDGATLAADVVVIAAGVRPEVTLARDAGLPVARGIEVDDAMRAAEAVFAVGECAEHRGTVHGLWAPLAEQARVAGATIAGDPAAFLPAATATTLKVAGLDLYTGGELDGDDEVTLRDTRRGVYRRLVLRGDRLVGATLLGDLTDARRCTTALRSDAAVEEELLAPGGPPPDAELPDDATVCSCNAVSAGAIRDAIRARGLTTVAGVATATRASTGCGGCTAEVGALLRRSSAGNTRDQDPKPPAARIGA